MQMFLLNFLTALLSVSIFSLMQYSSVGNSDFERGILVFLFWFVVSIAFSVFKRLSIRNLDEFLIYTVHSLFLEGVILLSATFFIFEPTFVIKIDRAILAILIQNFFLWYFVYSAIVKFLSSRVLVVPFLTLAISIPIAMASFNGFANYFVLLKGGVYTEFFPKDLIMSLLSFDLPLIVGVIFYGVLGYFLLKEKRF